MPTKMPGPDASAVLGKIFDDMLKWREKHREGIKVQPGSELAEDDATLAPFHLSHAVTVASTHAFDHLDTLRLLLVEAKSVPPYASYTLLRAAIENAATALYLVAPQDRQERVRRRLLMVAQDAADSDTVTKLIDPAHDGKKLADRRAMVEKIGVAAGLTKGDVLGKGPSWRTIIRTAGEVSSLDADEVPLLLWHALSGVAHGQIWADLAVLKKTEVEPTQGVNEDGVVSMMMTAGLDGVTQAAFVAWQFLSDAERLTNRRRLAWKQH